MAVFAGVVALGGRAAADDVPVRGAYEDQDPKTFADDLGIFCAGVGQPSGPPVSRGG